MGPRCSSYNKTRQYPRETKDVVLNFQDSNSKRKTLTRVPESSYVGGGVKNISNSDSISVHVVNEPVSSMNEVNRAVVLVGVHCRTN